MAEGPSNEQGQYAGNYDLLELRHLDPHHRVVELLKHDTAANAPQLAEAAELDPSYNFTQVLSAEDSELQFDQSGLIPLLSDEDKEVVEVWTRSNRRLSRHIRRFVAIVLIFFILVLLGALTRKIVGTKAETRTDSPPSLAYSPGASIGAPYTLLYDTSFAVATTRDDENRHLIFQDSDGTLREIVFNSGASKWNMSSDLIVARNARIHTPIAAMPRDDGVSYALLMPRNTANINLITIFYVQLNSTLTALDFKPGSGWLQPSSLNYTIDKDSRSLSVSEIPRSRSDQPEVKLLLFCQGALEPKGSFNVLNASSPSQGNYHIEDITNNTIASPGEEDKPIPRIFNGPFASGLTLRIWTGSLDTPTVMVQVIEQVPKSNLNSFLKYKFSFRLGTLFYDGVIESGTIGGGLTQPMPSNSYDVVAPGDREGFNWMHVDGFGNLRSSLVRPVPFKRLAVTNRTVSTEEITITTDDYFLYHQLDEITIAEDAYIAATREWKSRNITVGKTN